jgi:predicted ATPase/class 3 adenylate cyclase
MDEIFSLGQWIKRRRKALDMTQDELAQRVGCSKELIVKIEADARRPSKQIAERLADQLGLAEDEHVTFLRAARAELGVDRLAPPTRSVSQQALVPAAALPHGTVTFLFTDIEGSTQLWAHHPQQMGAAVARHEALLREAITAAGGVVFKTVGDAVYAAFASALDAVSAAVAGQRALNTEAWGLSSPLLIRMALHSGVVEARGGDYLGLPLSRVARLLAAGHGGQILLSLAIAELVREQLPTDVTLRDLGSHRLKDLSLPEQIYQLVAPDLLTDFPPLQTLSAQRTNLPSQPTALIGREREIADVATLLRRADVHLVTLSGPGGTGKTRLALQVAAELLDEFADGVYFVDLAPFSDSNLVATAIAQTLGVKERGGRPLLEELKASLRDRRLLLLLDNFEQVLDAASLIAALRAGAPGLKVLVTSRTVLHLSGEYEYAVPPLALPDRAHLPALEGLTQYAAVRLFIARAQAAQASFAVTNATAPAVAEICHRLDGLPLAIELAAARSKLFPAEALLGRLARGGLAMLSGGARDLPARQQTLRATIAWSYDLLDAAERRLFIRLGVFVGGCTIEAAEAVCGDQRSAIGDSSAQVESADLQSATLEGLLSLLDQSLVRQAEVNGEPRFTMLETIREYALERLEGSGEAQALRERHARHFMALAEAAEPELVGSPQTEWLNRLDVERDNLRTALAWSLTDTEMRLVLRGSDGSQADKAAERREHGTSSPALPISAAAAEVGWRLVAALEDFWHRRGPWSDGRMCVAVALARAPTATVRQQAAHAKALKTAGSIASYAMGDNTTARACFEESLAIYRALGDKPGIAAVLRNMGSLAWHAQDHIARNALLEESLALCRELDDKAGIAQLLRDLGLTAWSQGDVARATGLLEESLALSRKLNDKARIARALGWLGTVARWHGAYARAIGLLEQSLALSRELGDTRNSAVVLLNLGHAALAQGEYTRAVALLEQSLVLARETEERIVVAWALRSLGTVAQREGDHARAAGLHAQALAIYGENSDQWGIIESLEGLAAAAAGQGQQQRTACIAAGQHFTRAARLLGAAAALRASTGCPMSLVDREDVERATAVAGATLGEPAFTTALAEGRATPLAQAIAYALEGSDETQ